MSKNFGLPYMGSKSQIAEWVISKLPPADTFIEPFAGGCAVTHAAILSRKYKHIIYSDITDSAKVFEDAVNGRFRDEKRWISRDDFEKLKDTDPYARICFSFGNNQKAYAYNREIEPYKRAFHYAAVFRDLRPFYELGVPLPISAVSGKSINSRRLEIAKNMKALSKKRDFREQERLESLQSLGRLERMQSLESLQSLGRMQGLQSLQSLESLGRLERMQGDYRDVPTPTTGTYVIYCDPPYIGTAGYLNDFNHAEFYEWCRKYKENIFVSEYNMPEDFKMISAKTKRSLLSAKGKNKLMIEGLWAQRGKL